MGKYMRKGKVSGEVAVMEVPGGALLGVRTRSRTLALQRAQRPQDKGGDAAEDAAAAGEYLELRSRRLEKQHPPPPPATAAKRGAGRKAAAAATHALAEDDVEVSFGENVLDFDAMERSTRETTPCSLIRNPEMISTPGSTTKSKTSNSMTSRRRMETSVCRFIPSSHEMEEFSAAEKQEQHSFREKYNFCPVSGCPLPGRYKWARLDC